MQSLRLPHTSRPPLLPAPRRPRPGLPRGPECRTAPHVSSHPGLHGASHLCPVPVAAMLGRAVLCGCTRGTARSPWALLAAGPALGAPCAQLGMLPSHPGGAVPAACSLTGSPFSALAPCCLCSCLTQVKSRAKPWKPPPLCAGSRLLGQKSPLGSACAPCPAARALPALGPALGQWCCGAVEPSRCPVCCSQAAQGWPRVALAGSAGRALQCQGPALAAVPGQDHPLTSSPCNPQAALLIAVVNCS